jgi:hypothetical protein
MSLSRAKRAFLWVLKNTINRMAMRAARSGHGPFSVMRHVGRRSGTVYETPLILACVAEGFIAELTYGPDVNWHRNIVAAGGGVVIKHGVEYPIVRIEPCSCAVGRRAFGFPRSAVLTVLRRSDFRLLRTATAAAGDDGPE